MKSGYGEILKKHFESKGVSMYKVSKDTGISKQTVSNYLNETTKPNRLILEKLAQYLSIPLSDIIGEIDSVYESDPTYTTPNAKKEKQKNTGFSDFRDEKIKLLEDSILFQKETIEALKKTIEAHKGTIESQKETIESLKAKK